MCDAIFTAIVFAYDFFNNTTFFNKSKILPRFLSALWFEFMLSLLTIGINPNFEVITLQIANPLNFNTSELTDRFLQLHSGTRQIYK